MSGLNLPHAWWEQRPTLRLVRDAAYSRCVSPDAVLAAVLTRVAAEAHRATRGDVGLGTFSLNLLGGLIGPPAAGKSKAARVAEELLPFASPELRTMPLGSGEGLIELFMGDAKDDDGKRVRTQIRHNAHVYADEGESLFIQSQRKGATIGPTLRSAFTGGALGQANASKETSRVVTDYSLGVLFGFQPEVLAPLLAEAAQGTPQRFLFASAVCPHMPAEPSVWPAKTLGVGAPYREERFMDGGPYTFPDSVVRELWETRVAVQQGTRVVPAMDEHRNLLTAKVAVLLHIVSGTSGRQVSEDDWRLALDVVGVSVAVRDDLVRLAEQGRRVQQEAANQRAASRRAAETEAEHEIKIARLGKRLRSYVIRNGGDVSRSQLRRNALMGAERGDFEETLGREFVAGRLRVTEERVLLP